MSKYISIFCNTGNDKPKFHSPKNPNEIDDVNTDEILISKKFFE